MRHIAFFACLLAPLTAWAGAARLQCEWQTDPIAVNTDTPLLSWQITGDNPVADCELLVASSPDLLRSGKADLWQARLEADTHGLLPLQARYAGPALPPGAQAHWCVRLAGETAGEASATWVRGLRPEDWRAKWIAGPLDALPLLRKSFRVADKPVASALAYVCGLGHFELRVNGVVSGDHVLDPAWTDYRDTCLYVPFDVKRMLKPGENALGVMLGNGLYNVKGGRYSKFLGSFGEPKLIFQLMVSYEDGTREWVVSDESWRAGRSPITFSCMYGGEDYDARLEQPGWDTAGFDDAAWMAARTVDSPGGVLRAQDSPPIKVVKTLRPAETRKTAPGAYFLNLGENLSARPFLKVSGNPGQAVTVRVGELPDKPWDGHSYTYTIGTPGEASFFPRFTYFGFQYVWVEGADLPEDSEGSVRPVLLDAGAEFITSSAADVGAFSCSNELFNEIDAMITRSVRSNLQHVLTDCPHREKLGWLEVAHLMGPSILYRHDAGSLYRKICRDTTEAQLENGHVPDIAPEYTRFKNGFFESPEWGSASVQLPWLLYTWYGDPEILVSQFETMVRYTRYLAGIRNAQGLVKAGLGDWYDWTEEKGHVGYAQLTPGELTATAMLFDNARILRNTARLLRREAEAAEFDALAAQACADFRTAYCTAPGTVAGNSQAALAVGLYFDLVRDEERQAAVDSLVREIEKMKYRPTTGEVCFRYMILALAQAGRSDLVYRIIDRTDPPGYGCMLRQYGLRTLSEQWDKPGSSLNHCMFGHIQEWFQAYVLGIRQAPGSIGFEQLRIEPLFADGLEHAEGHFDSPRGRISVQWKRNGKNVALELAIPNNTNADFVLPRAYRVIDGATAHAAGQLPLRPGKHTLVLGRQDSLASANEL